VFCLVRTVHKFNYRLVNKTAPNKWRLLKSDRNIERDLWFDIHLQGYRADKRCFQWFQGHSCSHQLSTIAGYQHFKNKSVQTVHATFSQCFIIFHCNNIPYPRSFSQMLYGRAVTQLVEALRYKPEGRGFDSRWCHWN
jgi:hypothetical protein